MKKDQLLWVGLALILLVQGYLMWRINQPSRTDLNTLKTAEKIASDIDGVISQNNRLIERYNAAIAKQIDTLKVYERQKTIVNNHYETDLSYILSADRGAQFNLYKKQSAEFDSLFAAGFFIPKYGK